MVIVTPQQQAQIQGGVARRARGGTRGASAATWEGDGTEPSFPPPVVCPAPVTLATMMVAGRIPAAAARGGRMAATPRRGG